MRCIGPIDGNRMRRGSDISMARVALWLRAMIAAALVALPAVASAEMSEIKVAKQYGISYLPLMLIEDGKLIEKYAKAAGVDVTVTWATFAGGNVMNDALLSNSLQIASGGVGPLVILWSRTRGSLDIRGVGALNSMPLYLVTRNPGVNTIKDLTDKDRIGMPAVKISVQALALQMAAEQAFGPGQQNRLDPLTVTMAHPDAMQAMLSGQSEVDSHFGSPPYQYQELAKPGMHLVLNNLRCHGRSRSPSTSSGRAKNSAARTRSFTTRSAKRSTKRKRSSIATSAPPPKPISGSPRTKTASTTSRA